MDRATRKLEHRKPQSAIVRDFIAAWDQGGTKAAEMLLERKTLHCPQLSWNFLQAFQEVKRLAGKKV